MGKHHFVRIGSVLALFALAIRCDALLWDFNKKAQENDWKVISGKCEIDQDAYKISHNAEGLAISGQSIWTDYIITCKARLRNPVISTIFPSLSALLTMGKVSTSLYLKESDSRQNGGKRLVDSILKSKPLR